MSLRIRGLTPALVALSLFAAGCSADSREDDELSDDALVREDREYTFKYELPQGDTFKDPFKKAFPFEAKKHGVTLKATFTPTATVAITNPVVEGRATVGRRRIASALLGVSVPKVLDAELKASAKYSAKLDVDIALEWSHTIDKPRMDEVVRELREKTLASQSMILATRLGDQKVPLVAEDGTTREDLPLGVHYDIVVTCSIDELDGNLAGSLETGVEGTLVARAIYNVAGVEKRRFARDPKQKFELDTSDFKVAPAPKFSFKGMTQHVKGSCSVQPVAVVKFAKDAGVRIRVEAKSSFDTVVAARPDMTPEWRLHAKPELSVWGEADITIPILHTTVDKKALLFTRAFAEVDSVVGGEGGREGEPAPATEGAEDPWAGRQPDPSAPGGSRS